MARKRSRARSGKSSKRPDAPAPWAGRPLRGRGPSALAARRADNSPDCRPFAPLAPAFAGETRHRRLSPAERLSRLLAATRCGRLGGRSRIDPAASTNRVAARVDCKMCERTHIRPPGRMLRRSSCPAGPRSGATARLRRVGPRPFRALARPPQTPLQTGCRPPLRRETRRKGPSGRPTLTSAQTRYESMLSSTTFSSSRAARRPSAPAMPAIE